MFRQAVGRLKENAHKGISMAVVLCVGAFMLAFTAAIVYSAGLLTSQANQKLIEERCYQLAKSFAETIDAELTHYKNKDGSDGTFYAFANKFLEDTRYGTGSAFRYKPKIWSPDDVQKYGDVEILLKKEQESLSDELTGTWTQTAGYDFTNDINELKSKEFVRYKLTVEVVVAYDDLTYTYANEYERVETYDPTFMMNGAAVTWNETERQWYLGAAPQTYNGQAVTYTLTQPNQTTANIRDCYFRNIYKMNTSGGGGG